jgi:hypothetical protein
MRWSEAVPFTTRLVAQFERPGLGAIRPDPLFPLNPQSHCL